MDSQRESVERWMIPLQGQPSKHQICASSRRCLADHFRPRSASARFAGFHTVYTPRTRTAYRLDQPLFCTYTAWLLWLGSLAVRCSASHCLASALFVCPRLSFFHSFIHPPPWHFNPSWCPLVESSDIVQYQVAFSCSVTLIVSDRLLQSERLKCRGHF